MAGGFSTAPWSWRRGVALFVSCDLAAVLSGGVVTALAGCILLWVKMPKWKSWLKEHISSRRSENAKSATGCAIDNPFGACGFRGPNYVEER
jgi:hypothetical protein